MHTLSTGQTSPDAVPSDGFCPKCSYSLPASGEPRTCPECGDHVVPIVIAKLSHPITWGSIFIRFCAPLFAMVPGAAIAASYRTLADALLIIASMAIMINTSIQFMLIRDRPLAAAVEARDPVSRLRLKRQGNFAKAMVGLGTMAVCLRLLAHFIGP